MPPRSYRDAEPLAVWGFVLTFLFWPLGLVLSFRALRRIRKSGDGGWGLAVAGAALSTAAALSFGVAVLYFLATSGITHDTGGKTCVEGTAHQYSGSQADGDFQENVSCADLGVTSTLEVEGNRDREASQDAAREALAAPIQKRAQEAAAASSIREPPDMGRRGHTQMDRMACAAIAGNYTHVNDPETRQALIDVIDQYPVTTGTLEAVATLKDGLRSEEDGTDAAFDRSVLRQQFECWLGGYVGPTKLAFPPSWTVPLTTETLQADQDRVAAFKKLTAEQRTQDRTGIDDYKRELVEMDVAIKANH